MVSVTQLSRLTEWNSLYQQDYVAHGITSKNVEAVMKDGYLRPAEQVLRRTGKVEFEGGPFSGSREVVYLPQNVIPSEKLRQIQDEVCELFALSDEDIEKLVLSSRPRTPKPADWNNKSRTEQFTWLKSHALKDHERYTGEYFKNRMYLKDLLDEIMQDYPGLWKEKEKPRSLYSHPLVAMMIDKALPKEKRFKAQLTKVFEVYQRLVKEGKVHFSIQKLHSLFEEMRNSRLVEPYKIAGEIRVFRNSYKGCYGYVRVLIGGAEPIIGDKQIAATGEYELLAAGQNGGKFFKVDLSSPNVLIIGPELDLKDYAADPRFGKNVVFSENVP